VTQWVKASGFLIVPRPGLDCRMLWFKCGEKAVGSGIEKLCGDIDRQIRSALAESGCPVRRVVVDLGWGNVYLVDELDRTEGGEKCIDMVREVISSRYDAVFIPFVGQVPVEVL